MKLKKLILLIVAGAFFLAIGYLFFDYQVNNSHGNPKTDTPFEIQVGEKTWNIAGDLEKSGYIKNRIYFVFYVWKEGNYKKIKSGVYEFYSGITIPELAEIITKGDEKYRQVKITIPEGFNRTQIAQRLDENGFSGDDFLKKTSNLDWISKNYSFFSEGKPKDLEGFLFPDTYFFSKDSTTEDIITRMLDDFNRKISGDLEGVISKQGKSVYSVITMSSIIEREVSSFDDRKMVSDIFWRRLADGHMLQSSATITFITGVNKRQDSPSDIQIDSLYNTYIHPGLPPGPICNPGIESIEAALYPTKNDYYYFLNNPETGQTFFSKTFEEHMANKQRNGL